MCLYITTRYHKVMQDRQTREPRVAKRALLVYKVLTTWTRESPFRRFHYAPGVEYSEDMVPRCTTVDVGLHAFRSKARANNFRDGGERVYRAYVPKGATYYLGDSGDIVSDRLRVEGPI